MSILELFCSVDDFWQQFAPNWYQDLLSSGQQERLRPTQLPRFGPKQEEMNSGC